MCTNTQSIHAKEKNGRVTRTVVNLTKHKIRFSGSMARLYEGCLTNILVVLTKLCDTIALEFNELEVW